MSNTIITSICWIRKNWAKAIPLDYEVEDMKTNEKLNKVAKATKKLKEEGKLTGNETIKESTKIIEENIDMVDDANENDTPIVFSEDLKKFYTKPEEPGEGMEVDNDANPEYIDDVSDEEEDDFKIHPKDSLLVCGTAQDDFSNLEIYVYDEDNLSLFVHHDITLASFPLSLEWLPYKNNAKANYALVGSFTPEIEIWNLDIMGVLEPELVLGKSTDSAAKNLVHTDAVMCISLNPINHNIVASAGGDGKVLLWDLNSSPHQASACFKEHTDKVQSAKWNKCEDNVIVTGSFDKTLKLFDIRSDKSSTTIKVNSDVECIDWNPLNKYLFLASFENGRVDLFDIRKFDTVLTYQAHKKEATGVTFSPQKESLFTSCGRDCRVKIWDTQNIINDSGNTQPELVMEKFIKKSTGELFCCKFAEDCDYTISVGGSKGEMYIWQLTESPIFCSKFGLKYEDNVNVPDELNNLPNKKKIANKKNK